MTDDTTPESELPDQVEHTIFWLLDAEGVSVVTDDEGSIAEAAEAASLQPGYRVIVISARARPPLDANVHVEVADELAAGASASA